MSPVGTDSLDGVLVRPKPSGHVHLVKETRRFLGNAVVTLDCGKAYRIPDVTTEFPSGATRCRTCKVTP